MESRIFCRCWLHPLFLLYVLTFCINSYPAYGAHRQQTLALQRFLQATHNSESLPFNLSAPPCSWKGMVRCSSGNGTVITGLFLQGLGLKGTIPSSTLGELTSLTQLSLYNNSLQSPVPLDISSLSQLQYLSLSSNNFSEPFPAQLCNLSMLVRLDLSLNKFRGSIPTELNRLVHLKYLYLSFNGITGIIVPSSFSSLYSLRFIDLSFNRLTGHFPDIQLSNLLSLNLSSNNFTGLMNLEDLQNLSTLDLSYNSVSVSLGSVTTFPKLEKLIISNNKITGSISDLGNISMSALQRLDVSSNSISGSLDLVNFSRFTALTYMDVSSNLIKGSIPDSIIKAKNLTHFDSSNNNLSGRIPSSINQLGALEYLDLSQNSLVGNVTQLLELPSLKHLNLSYNKGLGCSSDVIKVFGSDSFAGVPDCHPFAADVVLHSKHIQSRSRQNLEEIGAAVAGCFVVVVFLLAAFAFFMCSKKRAHWLPAPSLSLRVFNLRKEDNRFMSGPFSFQSNSGPWAANVRNAASVPVIMFEKPLLNLTFADLLKATSCFDKESQVSQGGLGPVYSALLPGDLHVSIKVLIEGRILTNEAAAAEFSVLSNVKHPNIVTLLGYCIVGEERLVIYEFMKNGGLHRWLSGSPERSEDLIANSYYDNVSRDLATKASLESSLEPVSLTWPVRHKVGLGLARALSFLHHGHMVHRDVKTSNVMLDEFFEPHLANTGLAGLLAGSDDSLFAGGNPGYAPPEYGQPGGKVSTMGDVFSYGVILLELVTGKKPIGDTYENYDDDREDRYVQSPTTLVSWVRMLMQVKKSHLSRALDSRLQDDPITKQHMLEVLRIGYLCTAELPSKRPTIQQIVGLLKDLVPNIISP